MNEEGAFPKKLSSLEKVGKFGSESYGCDMQGALLKMDAAPLGSASVLLRSGLSDHLRGPVFPGFSDDPSTRDLLRTTQNPGLEETGVLNGINTADVARWASRAMNLGLLRYKPYMIFALVYGSNNEIPAHCSIRI